jgi:diketogulonate reductase-like aldo/keto reductase
MTQSSINRRQLIGAGLLLGTAPGVVLADPGAGMLRKAIPSSGEQLPVIGLGTYDVFDTDSSAAEIATRKQIVERLMNGGGSLLDTSPMYNRSEKVIGDVIAAGVDREALFLATKVWTDGQEAGAEQMQRSADLMKTDVIDLMQVHNLRDTALHMATIREWQAEGRIRYSGLTHYTAGAQAALAREMREFKPDFIQINYSLGERDAENTLLPMASDLGVAVLINRPFQAGRLFRAVSGKPLPEWATDFATSWGQFFLKFIISHSAVTCAIPATSKPHHMIDNIGAGTGELPDTAMRERMAKFFENL